MNKATLSSISVIEVHLKEKDIRRKEQTEKEDYQKRDKVLETTIERVLPSQSPQ